MMLMVINIDEDDNFDCYYYSSLKFLFPLPVWGILSADNNTGSYHHLVAYLHQKNFFKYILILLSNRNTVGKQSLRSFQIIDLEKGTILGKNQDGEILVKGPTVMKGGLQTAATALTYFNVRNIFDFTI